MRWMPFSRLGDRLVEPPGIAGSIAAKAEIIAPKPPSGMGCGIRLEPFLIVRQPRGGHSFPRHHRGPRPGGVVGDGRAIARPADVLADCEIGQAVIEGKVPGRLFRDPVEPRAWPAVASNSQRTERRFQLLSVTFSASRCFPTATGV